MLLFGFVFKGQNASVQVSQILELLVCFGALIFSNINIISENSVFYVKLHYFLYFNH